MRRDQNREPFPPDSGTSLHNQTETGNETWSGQADVEQIRLKLGVDLRDPLSSRDDDFNVHVRGNGFGNRQPAYGHTFIVRTDILTAGGLGRYHAEFMTVASEMVDESRGKQLTATDTWPERFAPE
jgi:hypothetical protein